MSKCNLRILVRRSMLFAALSVALSATNLSADTVHLENGGKVDGTVIDAETNERQVTILTRAGKQTLPRSLVQSIDLREENRVETYAQAKKRFTETAEDQYQLAVWCLKYQYRKESQEHLRKAIALDANHLEARQKLGYKRVGEEWKTEEEVNTAQGLVKDSRGKWVLPQQKEEVELKEAGRKKRTEYFQRVRTLKRMMYSENRTKASAASLELTGIKDVVAVEALMKYLGDPNAPESERDLLVDILGNIQELESTRALVKLAIEDASTDLRTKAAQQLLPRKSPELLQAAVGYLKNKDNVKVDNAGGLLGEIGDDSCVPELIDALVTKHTYIHRTTAEEAFAPPGATWQPFNAVRRFDGSIEYIPNAPPTNSPLVKDAIPNKRSFQKTHENGQVLAGLAKLTGEDHGYDKKRWLDWLKRHSRDKSVKSVGKG